MGEALAAIMGATAMFEIRIIPSLLLVLNNITVCGTSRHESRILHRTRNKRHDLIYLNHIRRYIAYGDFEFADIKGSVVFSSQA